MDDLQQALAALGLSWGDVWRLVADRRAGTLVVVAVGQTAVFALLPGFPDEVWQAINVILLWLIGTIAVEDAAQKLRMTNDE